VKGEIAELRTPSNTMVDFSSFVRVGGHRVVARGGRYGREAGRSAEVKGRGRARGRIETTVNQLAGNLTGAVARRVECRDADREPATSRSKNHCRCARVDSADEGRHDTMVDQLSSFASERHAGSRRKWAPRGSWRPRRKVEGCGGGTGRLTDKREHAGGNLTSQVRNIGEVTTAVREGICQEDHR